MQRTCKAFCIWKHEACRHCQHLRGLWRVDTAGMLAKIRPARGGQPLELWQVRCSLSADAARSAILTRQMLLVKVVLVI